MSGSADRLDKRSEARHFARNMFHALHNAILVEQVNGGLTMFIGPDRAGKLLEIGVVDGGEGPVVVHAMRARSKYLRLT